MKARERGRVGKEEEEGERQCRRMGEGGKEGRGREKEKGRERREQEERKEGKRGRWRGAKVLTLYEVKTVSNSG